MTHFNSFKFNSILLFDTDRPLPSLVLPTCCLLFTFTSKHVFSVNLIMIQNIVYICLLEKGH
uniref:Uncharacterized protein n=1 Tax=Solanum lycopersicum TaxID=4081 RepID=A0A3Q7JWD3_SOLLC